MKVLVLTTQFYQLNGAERLGVELAEALNRRTGWRADLGSVYRGDAPEVAEAEVACRDRGISIFHYLSMDVRPGPLSTLRAIRALRRLLREGQYDIVETSQVTPTILACWASWGLRTAHVAGIHDVFSRERYNSRKHRLWRFSVQGTRCAAFYAISEYVKEHWVRYSETPPAKTHLVLNAIPDDCFNARPERDHVREALGIPRDARIALFVGRMLKRKGIDTILSALGPILEAENLHLVYVGEWGYTPENFFPGEDTLRESMLSEIASQGWGDRVHFAGRRNDVPRIMASSDVLVHPARIEGFGLVLAEAMAAGLPVVASRVEGIPEVLAGTESVLVEPDDPEAVRAAVLTMLGRTPDETLRAVSAGRQRAKDFRIDCRIDALAELFEAVTLPDRNNPRAAHTHD